MTLDSIRNSCDVLLKFLFVIVLQEGGKAVKTPSFTSPSNCLLSSPFHRPVFAMHWFSRALHVNWFWSVRLNWCLILVDAKCDAKPMLICSFSNISLSPRQFISNQRPFGSFRAYRRSFKCNLVFGGFWYLPAVHRPTSNRGGICNSIGIWLHLYLRKYICLNIFGICPLHLPTCTPGGICNSIFICIWLHLNLFVFV